MHFDGLGSRFNCWEEHTMYKVSGVHKLSKSLFYVDGRAEEAALCAVEASWNVMAHVQKPVFVFRRNGQVHLNRRGRQFSRLLAAEVCASAVVMLDTPRSEVV